jgi:hypothetical protein
MQDDIEQCKVTVVMQGESKQHKVIVAKKGESNTRQEIAMQGHKACGFIHN